MSGLAFGVLAHPTGSSAQIRRQFGIEIPMRDGVKLAADLWLPPDPGPHPVILMRTPYLRSRSKHQDLGPYFASRGYVLVLQDVRGRGDSQGEFGFWFAEIDDGYDTVEWLGAQPWSTGKVGMLGLSYAGSTQWLAAKDRPSHLACIVPAGAGGRYFDDVPFQGGALLMVWALPWINAVSGRINQGDVAGEPPPGLDWEKIWAHRPLATADSVMGRVMPFYRQVLAHPTMDSYWKRLHFDADAFRKLDLPVLHLTGWFDGEQLSSLFNWEGMRAHSPAKDQQHLLIGPWTHDQTFFGGERRVGEMELSPDAVLDPKAVHLAFFEYCLAGRASRFDFPRARVYVTGINQWRSFDDYPPVEAAVRPLYLHSGGRANSLAGDGRLSWTSPADEPPDRYAYDPKHPVVVDGLDAASDHRPIERRDDVLVYVSDSLVEPVEIIGRVVVALHAASDARDTDFIVNLLDQYPDGRAVALGGRFGVLRARFRHGYEREELLTPGRPEPYRIELSEIGHRFLAGHRIRLEITSSAYPLLNPNQNTGNPVATDVEWKVANQTIYHDRARPSSVSLPVMPRR